MDPEKFLNSLINYERIPGYNYDLKAYGRFLAGFGNPHKNLKNVILVAGTKGKGSVTAIINSCLISQGYRVGIYSSPHLHKVNERIRVNNVMISDWDLNKYINIVRPRIDNKKGIRTYFEVLTTIAFFYFLDQKTDFTILEVGLGGRLDATNITEPVISVITRIGYDHTQTLGKRLDQIAFEKAGIIKDHGKTITFHQQPCVERVLKEVAGTKKSAMHFAEDINRIEVVQESIRGSRLAIDGELGRLKTFLPLIGRHQIQNLLIALAVISELKKSGVRIDPARIDKGIRQTELHGRFEIISPRPQVRAKMPLVIYDCAHNQDSFEGLNKNLDLIKKKKIYIIFGSKINKQIGYCLKNIFPRANEVVLVPINNPLGMDPAAVYRRARRYQKNITIMPSSREAVHYLKKKIPDNAAIIVTGSFYLWSGIMKGLGQKAF